MSNTIIKDVFDYINKYVRYEELLLRFDKIKKEANKCRIIHQQTFGDIEIMFFKIKIECIKKKKIIRYCQKYANVGEIIDVIDLKSQINKEMKEYNARLEKMIDEKNDAKKWGQMSNKDSKKIKVIYYKIAKLIHPDLNPEIKKYPELMELWHESKEAYEKICLWELESFEVLVNKTLKDLKLGSMHNLRIPDINDKIDKIEKEIKEIKGKPHFNIRIGYTMMKK